MATILEERPTQTEEEKRRASHDMLYSAKNTATAPAPKKEEEPVKAKVETKRDPSKLSSSSRYFSYNPYASHTIEEEKPKQAAPTVEAPKTASKMTETTLRPDFAQPTQPKAQTQTPVHENVTYTAPVAQPTVNAAPTAPVNETPVRESAIDTAPVEPTTQTHAISHTPTTTGNRVSRIRRLGNIDLAGSEPQVNDFADAGVKVNDLVVRPSVTATKEDVKEASFSMQAKIALTLVAAIVIIAFTVIFVNSSLINSLAAQVEQEQQTIERLSEETSKMLAEVEQATGEEAATIYAESVGMIRGE